MKLAVTHRSVLFGGIFAIGALALTAALASSALAERRHRDKFDSREVCDVRDRADTATFDAWWYQRNTRIEQWYREKFRRLSPLERIHLTVESR